MVKKLLTFLMGLSLAVGAMAQGVATKSVTVVEDSVQFWAGMGSNSTLVCIGWDATTTSYEKTVVVWGVRWNGTITLQDALDTIAAYDSRFTYTMGGGGLLSELDYNDAVAGIHLSPEAGWNCNSYGVGYGNGTLSSTWLRISESTCNNYNFTGVDNIIYAAGPNAVTPGEEPAVVVVAEGTSAAYMMPFSFMNAPYAQWSQSIYLSSELTELVGKDLTTFTYHTSLTEEPELGEYTISLGITTLSVLEDGKATSATTQVFSGTPVYEDGNIVFTFDTPFRYEGGNLLVYFDHQAGTTTASVSAPFASIETASSQRRSRYACNNAYSTSYGSEGVASTYLPSIWVTATEAAADSCAKTLPYEIDFSGYTLATNGRPYEAGAPLPECWTVLSNGRYTRDTTATMDIYFSGIGTYTSTNGFGAIAGNDPYFSMIACQYYDGTSEATLQNVLNYGTRKFAILPSFDQPINQTILTFDHRCSPAHEGACLLIGYCMGDTASFVGLDSIPIDYRILHHDTLHYNAYPAIPTDARIAFCWKSTDTAHTGGPSNYYCGIDNLKVEVDTTPAPSVTPTEATIAAEDILYWIGTGDDQAIFIFDAGDTALAWGYRFDEDDELTVEDMIVDIDEADPRFNYAMSWTTFEYELSFVESPARIVVDTWRVKTNGELADELDELGDLDLEADMVVKVSTDAADIWSNPVHPASVATMPVNSTIDASEIEYWVGSGSNSAVVAINWGVPDTALAWGIRWSGSLTVVQAMDTLVANDPRLTSDMAHSTFNYDAGSTTLSFQPVTSGSYMQFRLNDNGYAGLSNIMYDGDFLKIGESTYGIGYDSTQMGNYWYPEGVVWPTTIYPVSDPNDTTPDPPTDPVDATIAFGDILYWVGSGSDSAAFIVSFAQPDTAFAWGYLFNGSTTAQDMIDAIDVADPRFWTVGTPSNNGDIHFILENGDTLGLSPIGSLGYNFWWSNLNGVSAGSGASSTLHNGDVFKYGDMNSAIGWDYMSGFYMEEAWVKRPTPVTIPDTTATPDTTIVVEEATIAPGDILYWVGSGSNEVVLAVNWADTALAWGYRFDGANTTVATMMTDIAAADPRFSYSGVGYIGDIFYIDAAAGMTDTLRITPGNYWESSRNGIMDAGMGQQLVNGDFEKWADPAAGTPIDSTYYEGWGWYYTNAYPMEIHPISVPDTTTTPDTTTVVEDASFDAADILYWVGTGSNEVVMAVNWADTALAWGYRFDGESTTVSQMMDDIAAADPRFSYTASGFVSDIVFTDSLSQHNITPGSYWYSLLNHVSGMGLADQLHNGDFYKWGDLSVAVVTDSTWVEYGEWSYWDYTDVWPYTIYPVSVPDTTTHHSDTIVDASIAPSAIRYWVGQGSNQAIIAVNWAAPDTCLAWGVKWNGTAVLSQLMDTMAQYDSRFSYTANGSMLSDIFFVENGDTLKLTTYSSSEWGNYWSFLVNGSMGMSYFNQLEVAHGDFVKWGDPNSGDTASIDEWGYPVMVWTTNVTPISAPSVEPEHGPYCGAVGTEGCEAIQATDQAIVAWAATCVVTRGPQNIANPNSPAVTYGNDDAAVGAVSATNNLNVVSLGDGGSAVLTFDTPIANGDGFDFAVFENGFDDNFLELAFVEVSSDGEHFVRFPAVSLTQTEVQTSGIGTTDPTMIDNLAGKYRNGWGTPFDLDELRDSANLDIDHITHVRIVDVVGSIDSQYGTRDSRGNLVNDPWPTDSYSSGFDLAGVGVMHQAQEQPQAIDEATTVVERLYPNPTTDRLNVQLSHGQASAQLFDFAGRQLANYHLSEGGNILDLSVFPAGIYILKVEGNAFKIVKQ